MNILFVWTGVTSYAADCWRLLQRERDVTLRIVADVGDPAVAQAAYRADDVLRELDCVRVTRFGDVGDLRGFRPDVIFAVGWHSEVVRGVVASPLYAAVPKVCCFDMPWRWKLRCLAAPLVLGRFLRRYDAAFVPGAAAARYARWLGFRTVCEGLCAVDTARFVGRSEGTAAPSGGSEAYFLFLGRNSPEKRIDDIRAAHALYRAGGGKIGLRLHGKGLEDGFVAPADVPAVLRGAVAIVLASVYDHWPLVLLEAMAAGCPVIASDRCTNRPELGRNWRVFRCGDVKALAREFFNAEVQLGGEERNRGIRENAALARHYDCGEWVRRVRSCCRTLGVAPAKP